MRCIILLSRYKLQQKLRVKDNMIIQKLLATQLKLV